MKKKIRQRIKMPSTKMGLAKVLLLYLICACCSKTITHQIPWPTSLLYTLQKMIISQTNKILNIFIALVWLVNGLFCKVLNLVPRHQEIIGKILQIDKPTATIFTILIGLSEILMAIWIITRIMHRFNAMAQIAIIATMNILEFIFVPELLLWGKLNSFIAFLFIVLIYFNEFIFNRKPNV